MKYLLVIYSAYFILTFSNCKNFQLIISFVLNNQSIESIKLSINSILNQDVDQSLYKIILIATHENRKYYLSNELISFLDEKRIPLNIFSKRYNFQNILIKIFEQWPNKPILIINGNIIFPEGWLEMFIRDHEKYPNDIIAGSIQYFLGENLEIKNFSEGYKGKYYGNFNHIANIIFNFAFIKTELGGTLFPPFAFKNKMFYNLELFSKISSNSNNFWISCFIMLENKVLRQSSKIYDFTQYIINKNEFINETENSIEENLSRMLAYFPWFKKVVKNRQQKVIISMTSYPQRFEFLSSVIDSIKNQSFLIKDIKLVLYKKHKKLYKLDIDGIDINIVNEDLKPHKKYYYTMSKYRDYAILTLDDDTIYCNNMINSLYKSYIEHPNIISGRGGHYMKYQKNGELTGYLSWFSPTNLVKSIDFNIFLIGVGGIIYPPDILNINEKHLDIIKEFIIGDDFVLKHLEIQKGIEQRLIQNNHPQGLYMKNNSFHRPLYDINKYKNDIYIKKINTAIDNEIIKDLCINYKNVKTGLVIYLFNINNIKVNGILTTFYLDAYSFCQIDNNITFQLKFDKITASCKFKENYSVIEENFKIQQTKRILVAFCFINRRIKNLNQYYFPKVISLNNSNLIINNKNKYIPIIFKDFYLIDNNKYILKLIFFKSYHANFSFNFEINNIKLECILSEEIKYKNDEKPIIKNVYCNKCYSFDINKKILISGLPKNNWQNLTDKNDNISNIFIISKIYFEIENMTNYLILKGKLINDLKDNISDLRLDLQYPKETLICSIQSGSRFIQIYIFCEVSRKHTENIFLENQVIYSKTNDFNLLLLSSETLFQNYRALKNNNDYQILYINIDDKSKSKIILIIFLIFILLKNIKNNYK